MQVKNTITLIYNPHLNHTFYIRTTRIIKRPASKTLIVISKRDYHEEVWTFYLNFAVFKNLHNIIISPDSYDFNTFSKYGSYEIVKKADHFFKFYFKTSG